MLFIWYVKKPVQFSMHVWLLFAFISTKGQFYVSFATSQTVKVTFWMEMVDVRFVVQVVWQLPVVLFQNAPPS